METFVVLREYDSERLAQFAVAFPQKEPETRKVLEAMLRHLSKYGPNDKVDLTATVEYFQEAGHKEAAQYLAAALIKRDPRDLYSRIA